MGRVVVYASAGLLALVLLIGGAAGGVVAAIFGGGEPAAAALACTARVNNPGAVPAGLSAEQARNAAVIIGVGQRMGIPVRGWVIAIATALQESDLINSGAATDHDSLGLFQQRPSQGWGTPAQIMDPAYASAAFYTALRHVPGWQSLPLTVAAQRVQKSATPDAYQKHEARATAIVAAYTGGAVCDGGDGTTGAGVTLPPGFRLPPGTPPQVVTAIGWALAQLGTPYAFGGDCTAARSGDPAHECDCSSLVILSPTILWGCDLRFRVEDGVVDAVLAGVFADQRSGGSSPRRDAVRSSGPVGVTGRVPGDALAGGATG